MNINLEAKYLEGRNNPWRVSMTVPGDASPIVTRLDAKDEAEAKQMAWAKFIRVLARREKGEEASLAVAPQAKGARK